MTEIKCDLKNINDKIEYDQNKGKTEWTINGDTYHVYQIRNQNPFTYLGYLLCLITNKWESVSYKGNNALVRKKELNSLKNSVINSKKTEKNAIKAFETHFTESNIKNPAKMAKTVYKHLVKNPLPDIDKPKILHPTNIDDVGLLAIFNDKSMVVQSKNMLGKGAFKEVFSGLKYKVHSATKTSIKIEIASVAILKIKNNGHQEIQTAKKENQIASKFAGNHVVKESKACFDDQDSWVMVNDMLPVFFDKEILLKREDAIRAAKGAAKGLAEIHNKGFIHRDIKPANMAIQQNGKGTITDLGTLIPELDKHLNSGTPYFFPPELIKKAGDKYIALDNSQNAQGDLWAFGLSLYRIFHPKRANPTGLKNVPSLENLYLRLHTIREQSDSFKACLFQDWPAANENEKRLQDTIGKLLSVNPNERGTAEEAYASLRAIQKAAS